MAIVERFSDFLRNLHRTVPSLELNRIDKQYLAGPSIEGVELSVGVRDQGYSVRLVLSGGRMSAGNSLYAKVLELTKGQPDVEVEQWLRSILVVGIWKGSAMALFPRQSVTRTRSSS